MSKLVEIKAELLKWCPCGFKFYSYRYKEKREFIYNHKSNTVYIYDFWIDGKISSGWFKPKETIEVNPKDYEQAVIQRIKETIDNSEGNKMKITKSAGVISLWALPIISGDWFIMVKINCDPRPHEETYTIYLQEEDNE